MPRRISKEEAEALLAQGAVEVPRRKVSAAEAEALLAQGATALDERGASVAKSMRMPEGPAMLSPRSESGTALRSFGQGAGAGFTDEASGLSGALQEAKGRGGLTGFAATLAGAVSPQGIASAPEDAATMASGVDERALYKDRPLMQALLKRYVTERNQARGELEAGREENPKLAFGSELAGMATTPTGRAGPLTSVESRFLQHAKQGAKVGAATGRWQLARRHHHRRGLPPRGLAETGWDVAKGGALGGALSGVLGTGLELGRGTRGPAAAQEVGRSAARCVP